jgi:molybdopterin/thiamine biosynthesis adenylyltransferase
MEGNNRLKLSIYESEYDCFFFKKFDIVISALDNIPARKYLSKMCIICSIPLIDAGTGGYSSHTKTVIKYLYKCHNCEPDKK